MYVLNAFNYEEWKSFRVFFKIQPTSSQNFIERTVPVDTSTSTLLKSGNDDLLSC